MGAGRREHDHRRGRPPRRAAWEQAELDKYARAAKTPPRGWQDKYQEPPAPDTTDLPELPEGWCWATLGRLFAVTIGGTPARDKPEYWNGHIPWVSSGEVAVGRIVKTREQITPEGLANSNAKLHAPGTVLLAMIGEGKTRGQVALLEGARAGRTTQGQGQRRRQQGGRLAAADGPAEADGTALPALAGDEWQQRLPGLE